MTEHVGPFHPAVAQHWILQLEKLITEQLDELDELVTAAEANGYAELVKNLHERIAIRQDSLKKLKEHYLT